MSRIAQMFAHRNGAQQTALIPYITAGYPAPEMTLPLMRALASNGGDLIELGVPFSDPMADGPVIQAACHAALQHKVGLRDALDTLAAFRAAGEETPVVFMSYCNPILAMGVEKFADAAARAGLDGLLLVDLPPEDGGGYLESFKRRGLDTVLLVSPTTMPERSEKICSAASGFVYYVSLKGVTGAGHLDADAVGERVAALKRLTDLPVAVGFGVSDAESAKRLAKSADGVVIGSALVRLVADVAANGGDVDRCCGEAGAWLAAVRSALDAR